MVVLIESENCKNAKIQKFGNLKMYENLNSKKSQLLHKNKKI